MDAKELMEMVLEALEGRRGIERVQTFVDAGIRSNAPGIVVTAEGGEQFHLSFSQTLHAPDGRLRTITFKGEVQWQA